MDLLQATAQTVTVEPRERLAPVTAAWVTPRGASSSAVATLDTVDTTVTDATEETATLADATGITVGRRYALTTGGRTIYPRAASVSGSVVTWAEPLASAPAAGDTIKGLAVEVAVTATHTADRGVGYRIRLTDGAGGEHVVWCSVVRHLFSPAATADDVSEYLARIAPSAVRSLDWCEDMADRARRLVRTELDKAGLRPSLFGDADAFRDAGRLAVRFVIARDDAIFPPHTQDREAWLRDADMSWRAAVSDAASSLASYDSDDDDGTDDEPRRVGMVTLRRTA